MHDCFHFIQHFAGTGSVVDGSYSGAGKDRPAGGEMGLLSELLMTNKALMSESVGHLTELHSVHVM